MVRITLWGVRGVPDTSNVTLWVAQVDVHTRTIRDRVPVTLMSRTMFMERDGVKGQISRIIIFLSYSITYNFTKYYTLIYVDRVLFCDSSSTTIMYSLTDGSNWGSKGETTSIRVWVGHSTLHGGRKLSVPLVPGSM